MAELYRPAFIHDYDIEITQKEDWVIGFRCLPRTDQGVLYLEDTTGYTGILSIYAPDPSGTEILTVDTLTGHVQVGFTPAPVEQSTAYGLGQKIVPAGGLNGFVYECTVAGTTDTDPVIWPEVIGDTVPYGTATFRCETDDSQVCNVSIFLGSDVTDVLEPWGRGHYSIVVKDTFNHSWVHIDGAAYLRPTSMGPVG